ncbi:MAG: hypothetical protein K2G63_07635 [Oscillospiraceae bacterium]|nr:hypothetical protein [Oscillospiraceae bacterium]
MDWVNKTVKKFNKSKSRYIRKFYSKLLIIFSGLDLGLQVKIGKNVNFKHGGLGTVIHTDTIIEDDVIIMSNVTVGRSDVWIPKNESDWGGITLKRGCVICTGARIIGKGARLIVGENTIVGANAVLTCSTGNNEVWAGIPARKIKDRD